MKIYLIRHTTPQVEKGICYGQTDLDVHHTFEEEVAEIKSILPQPFQIPLFSSPLQRCFKLATALSGSSLQTDSRLKELHFGDWEMKSWAEINPNQLNYWMQKIHEEPTPNGESHADLHARVSSFWEEIMTAKYEEVGIVSHYGVMQALLSQLLHIPVDKVFRIDLGYGAVIRVSISEQQFYKIKFLR